MTSAGGLNGSAGDRPPLTFWGSFTVGDHKFHTRAAGDENARSGSAGGRKSVPYAPDRDAEFHAENSKKLLRKFGAKQLIFISAGSLIIALIKSQECTKRYFQSVVLQKMVEVNFDSREFQLCLAQNRTDRYS